MPFGRSHSRSKSRSAPSTSPFSSPAPRPPTFLPPSHYAAAAGLSKQDIETRVLDVLKGFEKVDGSKVRFGIALGECEFIFLSSFEQLSPSSHFSKDLGLDSLDAVEVVMAVEEVFPSTLQVQNTR